MTDDPESGDGDGFLARWSRRKRAAREDREAAAPADTSGAADEEAVDPATLPALDTLGADSDYTVFLKKGVPKALRLAALRKAWASDPAITGYRTLADYDWDCNAPGYGALRPTDDARKVAEALFRHLREDGPAADGDTAQEPAAGDPPQQPAADDAPPPGEEGPAAGV
ncbi:DUF3306 domain-containing protein [Azospirillum sp. ST 5-10]|uniref:DUF3306 domain-containing protein n=1 Tax=unclassified Azospirillum TaxID=2630922 RepID=UPI003F4A77DB